MADSQIFSGAVADGQSVYELPGPIRFVLKAVNADFADNGAGSTWLPAVVIGSDSGHVIARAVDQAVSVAAGSDAACSFFPGVKHAAGAAPGVTSLPWALASGLFTLASGSTLSGNASLTMVATSDSTRYTISGGALSVNEEGTYLIFVYTAFTTGSLATTARMDIDFNWTPNGFHSSSFEFQADRPNASRSSGAGPFWQVTSSQLYNLSALDLPLTLTSGCETSVAPSANVTGFTSYAVVYIAPPIAALF